MEQKDDWHLTELLHNAQGRGDPFAAAVRATRMPMVITDPKHPDNAIVFVNEAFQSLTGYTRDEIIGQNCRFLQGPNTNQDNVAKVRAAIAAGESIDVDLLNYRKDGSTFWNALYISPVRSDEGIIQFFFASQMDVTDRVRAQKLLSEENTIIEQEVRRRTGDLEAALDAKTMLLHEVDHRVKNNLTMIGALLRLQARTIGDEQFSRRLSSMIDRVDALAGVHRQLYQSSELTNFDLSIFAKTLLQDIVGASGRHDIETHVDLQPLIVSADKATALGLVLNEIITNAVKHAFADGRAGTLRLRTETVEGGVEISVTDDGKGTSGLRPSGLGHSLISRLSTQAKCVTEWRNANPGTTVAVIVPTQER